MTTKTVKPTDRVTVLPVDEAKLKAKTAQVAKLAESNSALSKLVVELSAELESTNPRERFTASGTLKMMHDERTIDNLRSAYANAEQQLADLESAGTYWPELVMGRLARVLPADLALYAAPLGVPSGLPKPYAVAYSTSVGNGGRDVQVEIVQDARYKIITDTDLSVAFSKREDDGRQLAINGGRNAVLPSIQEFSLDSAYSRVVVKLGFVGWSDVPQGRR